MRKSHVRVKGVLYQKSAVCSMSDSSSCKVLGVCSTDYGIELGDDSD